MCWTRGKLPVVFVLSVMIIFRGIALFKQKRGFLPCPILLTGIYSFDNVTGVKGAFLCKIELYAIFTHDSRVKYALFKG